MRIKNSMRNMFYIYAAYLLIVVLNFVVRRIFLDVLTIDYLGYDGLFTSIFSFLSLSEMGVASIITYHMYSEIAAKDIFRIRKLLYIYKLIYRIIGFLVLALGLLASLFLPLILEGQELHDSWTFIYTIYFLQLTATLCTYFLAYRRILFITHQRIYVCTAVDTAVNIVCVIAKMIVLLKWRNYILYLLISILNNILTNLIITILSKKEYPEITSIHVDREDMRELNLGHEVKNMLVTRIATTVYGASDNIIITRILGIGTTGLIDNYKMLTSKINELVLSLFNSLQASIGNLVYDNDKDKGVGFFHALDLTGFFMGLVSATGLITVGQQVIVVWLHNEKYLLPYAFLILIAVNMYIAISNNPIVYFRNSLGHFEADRNYMIAAATVNIVLSILLGIRFGITGVMVGTVAGHILIYIGRTVVVYRYYIDRKPVVQYLTFGIRLLILAAAVVLSAAGTRLLASLIGSRILLILVSGVLSVVVSTLLFVLTSFRSEAFRILCQYIRAVFGILFKKGKKQGN